jgi:type IV pilus assembly protein PilE
MSLVNKQGGFTLIELMIVVVIIGLISALAFPSYQSIISSSTRNTAQADLISFAAAMERHHASSYTYKGAGIGGANIGQAKIFAAHSPSSEPAVNRKYDLTIDDVSYNGLTYRLKAAPLLSGLLASNGALYIYSDGRRAWDADNNGIIAASEYCWSC